ncbi:MAG: AraC family transcriptional regulator [Steroidobacteraceae bacterium]|jgi:AraC-like DNA-binding protein
MVFKHIKMISRDTHTGSGSESRGTAAGQAAEPGTIAVCFVAAALQSFRARHLNTDELLATVGLSPSLLEVPQARVSAKVYGALWRAIARALDDEFFGQDSRRLKAGSFAMLCHSVINCKTLARALVRSAQFYALMLDDISASVQRDAKEARLVLHERLAGASQRVFAHETILMLLHGVSCWLVGRRIPIMRAEFSYKAPAHSEEYRLMYCNELRFDRPNTLIAFDASYLDLPLVQDERSIQHFLQHAPENILLKYKNASSLSARIRRRLRRCLGSEFPDFETLADELDMTPATVRRRLQVEGSSYQSIKDHLRRDLAISYLSDSSRSVMDIALQLGFSERSAFHRAFTKWTGASPGEFRRTLQA